MFSAGDGLISLDEFSQLINGLGLDHATPGTIVALFNKYDSSNPFEMLKCCRLHIPLYITSFLTISC
jgi:hypothetical protein